MILGGEHKIALENPTYKQAYRLFKNLSYEVCTVDMDDKGMRVDELRKSDADISICDAFASISAWNSYAYKTANGTFEMGAGKRRDIYYRR